MPHAPEYIDLLGAPFERGARGPKSFDCYGLAIEMFRRIGVTIPDFESPGTLEEVASLIASNEVRWSKVPFGTPNSLVTLRVEGIGAHVGFMIEPDRFVHAFDPIGVTTERLRGGQFTPLGFYTYG
jgi:cell wall-associated NlpC family hydrolase